MPAHLVSESCTDQPRVSNYSSIVALEALSLPDRHVDCIYPVANSCNDSGNYQLHALRCRSLQNSPGYHDPASTHDTTLSSTIISRQECHNCTNGTADVINSGDGPFELGAWIVEVDAKRWQSDYGAEDTLVIAEKLVACQSVLRIASERWCLRYERMERSKPTRNAIPQIAAMAPRRADPVNAPYMTFSDEP